MTASVAATAAAATSKALVVPTDAAVGRSWVPMNVSPFFFLLYAAHGSHGFGLASALTQRKETARSRAHIPELHLQGYVSVTTSFACAPAAWRSQASATRSNGYVTMSKTISPAAAWPTSCRYCSRKVLAATAKSVYP